MAERDKTSALVHFDYVKQNNRFMYVREREVGREKERKSERDRERER